MTNNIQEYISPSQKYRVINFRLNINKFKIKIIKIENNEVIFNFKTEYHFLGFNERSNQELLEIGNQHGIFIIFDLGLMKIHKSRNSHDSFSWLYRYWSPDKMTLCVHGFFPACSGELYRFYDFSDLNKGWPELKIKRNEMFYQEGQKQPHWNEDGTFTIYFQYEYFEHNNKLICELDDEYDTLGLDNGILVTDKIITLKRVNDKIEIENTWKSENEIARDIKFDLWKKNKFEENQKVFEKDEYCQKFIEILKDMGIHNYEIDNTQKNKNYETGIGVPILLIIIYNHESEDEDFPIEKKMYCEIKWEIRGGPFEILFWFKNKKAIFEKYPKNLESISLIMNKIKKYFDSI